MSSRRSVFVLRLVLGVVVGGSSLELVLAQLHRATHPAFLLLGIAELAAAILFLISKTLCLGGVALIVIFAVAAIFHALHHQYGVAYLGRLRCSGMGGDHQQWRCT